MRLNLQLEVDLITLTKEVVQQRLYNVRLKYAKRYIFK